MGREHGDSASATSQPTAFACACVPRVDGVEVDSSDYDSDQHAIKVEVLPRDGSYLALSGSSEEETEQSESEQEEQEEQEEREEQEDQQDEREEPRVKKVDTKPLVSATHV